MSRDALVFAAAGTFFGILIGWILGSQARPFSPGAAGPPAAAAAPAPGANAAPAPRPLDLQQVTALEAQAKAEPGNAKVRVDIGNLYFDADQFQQAIPWYQAALKINPRDANASTDLAVCFYSINEVDQALAQLDHSLTVDPAHVKTLLNQGIIRAFGKQDFAGAQASWERVVAIAPDSEEGRRARQGLDGIKAAHGSGAAGAAGS